VPHTPRLPGALLRRSRAASPGARIGKNVPRVREAPCGVRAAVPRHWQRWRENSHPAGGAEWLIRGELGAIAARFGRRAHLIEAHTRLCECSDAARRAAGWRGAASAQTECCRALRRAAHGGARAKRGGARRWCHA
jgi:hypothetical protein